MSDQVVVSRGKLVAVADAIRDKTSTTNALTLDEMATAIEGIQGSGGDDGELLRSLIARTMTSYVDDKLTKIETYVFYQMPNLTVLETPSVTKVGLCGVSNTSVTHLSFPNMTSCDTYAFQNNKKLTSFSAPLLPYSGGNVLSNCVSLETVNLQSLHTIVALDFSNCTKLGQIDLLSCRIIQTKAFTGCNSLKTIILRYNNVCTLVNIDAFTNCYHFYGTVDATYNPDGLKDGFIYVPKALIEDYKVATNWAALASQFRAIEDYPEITGG